MRRASRRFSQRIILSCREGDTETMNELHGISDADLNTYLMMREAICEGVCGKGRSCSDMLCLECMLKQAGRIVEVADNERAD